MMLVHDYKLTEVVTRFYSTNHRVDIGRYLQAIVTLDVAKAGTHHKQRQTVVTSSAHVGVVVGFLEALSQIEAITVLSPVFGWT